jgi:ribosomal-protein-alanine N-acetyltransferase
MNVIHFAVQSEQELVGKYLKSGIVEFLHKNLQQYRDSKEHIEAAMDYAFSKSDGKGGFVMIQEIDGTLTGVSLVNKTGMRGYIPENILVYLATDPEKAPLGSGTRLLERTLGEVKGSVALHVEYDNPARRIYERMGFTSKYAEMRYVPQ